MDRCVVTAEETELLHKYHRYMYVIYPYTYVPGLPGLEEGINWAGDRMQGIGG